jgi:hypothetical protein
MPNTIIIVDAARSNAEVDPLDHEEGLLMLLYAYRELHEPPVAPVNLKDQVANGPLLIDDVLQIDWTTCKQ